MVWFVVCFAWFDVRCVWFVVVLSCWPLVVVIVCSLCIDWCVSFIVCRSTLVVVC